MEGGKDILRKTSPEKKADWMRGAMLRMNKLLPMTIRKAVREGCACCLGGKCIKTSKKIASENATLEERIKAANAANYWAASHCLQTEKLSRALICKISRLTGATVCPKRKNRCRLPTAFVAAAM